MAARAPGGDPPFINGVPRRMPGFFIPIPSLAVARRLWRLGLYLNQLRRFRPGVLPMLAAAFGDRGGLGRLGIEPVDQRFEIRPVFRAPAPAFSFYFLP